MKEFFHGWRRKAGGVTLGLALVLCGMWARSLYFGDQAWCTIGNRTHFLMSAGGRLSWASADANETRSLGFPAFGMQPYERGPEPEGAQAFRWEFNSDLWAVSHYMFIAPLTLLSAYLTIWKPRKRASPN